jgi:hypothetical protein
MDRIPGFNYSFNVREQANNQECEKSETFTLAPLERMHPDRVFNWRNSGAMYHPPMNCDE